MPSTTPGRVFLRFSAQCGDVEGEGWACMVDETAEAVGHVAVAGGPHDGRFLAVLCGRHASEAGLEEFMARLLEWMMAGLLGADLGPGPSGVPEVLHREPGGDWHRDMMPEHRHDGA
jgi:hypothetical protein